MNYKNNENRIDGLDGLRAIAVIVIFLHHTGLTSLHGGFIGVDLFFVLSGYLITRILLNEHLKVGKIDVINFYWRRMKRLYPALVFFLFIICLYIFFFEKNINLTMEIIPSALYFMNWIRAFQIYDAPLTGHTWTLSIEQQFYLLWPFAMIFILSFRPRKAFLIIFSMIFSIVAWRLYLYNIDAPDARIYAGFDTHSDGLVIGTALAFGGNNLCKLISKFWMLSSAYIIFVLSTKTGDSIAASSIGFLVTSLASASLIAKIVTEQDSILVKILKFRPIAFLGMISYGFYLWHYSVIKIMLYSGNDQFGAFFGSFEHAREVMLAATFMITLVLTLLSWYLVEKPILNAKSRYTSEAITT